ncbi:hypothetical protein ABH908_002285 [Pseudomonas frederiksbergensis]
MTKTKGNKDWVKRSAQPLKMERIEAFFGGHGFTPHRHDTYAIGRTLSGVQSFQYRKSQRHSLPGKTIVLHPDEVHDGEAGTEAGFHYRMIYIEPALIQQVLGGKPLPFIEGGLSSDPRLGAATQVLLQNLDACIEPLEEDDAIYDLAQALDTLSGQRGRRKSFDFAAAERARALIHDSLDRVITLDELSQASGRDRWSLSRDFRALYGTRPLSVHDSAPARPGKSIDGWGPLDGRGGRMRRFFRPKPHDASIRPDLRRLPRPVAEEVGP